MNAKKIVLLVVVLLVVGGVAGYFVHKANAEKVNVTTAAVARQDLLAIDLRQVKIENCQIRHFIAERLKGFYTVTRVSNAVIVGLQPPPQECLQSSIVFHYQQPHTFASAPH